MSFLGTMLNSSIVVQGATVELWHVCTFERVIVSGGRLLQEWVCREFVELTCPSARKNVKTSEYLLIRKNTMLSANFCEESPKAIKMLHCLWLIINNQYIELINK